MSTQTATRDDFLAAVFPDAESGGFIELRTLRGVARGFFSPRDFAGIERFVSSHADRDLFFGVATRRQSGDGSLANCSQLSALFCDIDFKSTAEADARERLARFPLRPSIVVGSGGGLHVYFLLREALDLTSDADRARSLLRRLAHALGGDLAAAEPARVLRVPGTLNFKYTPPRPVVIESLDGERRYNASELDDLLQPEPAADGWGARFTLPEEIAKGDPGRDNMLYRFGRKLKCAGLTEREIADAMHAANAARCKPPLPKDHVDEKARHVATQGDRADFRAERTQRNEQKLTLTPLRDLLSEPEEQVPWLLEECLPAGGGSVLVAKPKFGKSTLARCLALAVARGERFLERETRRGPVLYLALEEKRSEVRSHFAAMGATEADQIFVFIAPSPEDGLKQLRDAAERERPALIIVDPLLKLIRVKDADAYAAVTHALEPLMSLARQTGAHILAVHHSPKTEREVVDAPLGSTAIAGAVDTVLLLRRKESYRTLASIQRYGNDLEEIIVMLDPVTRTLSAGPSRREADEAQTAEAILDYLQGQSEAVEEAEINEAVEGRTAIKRRALRVLVEQEKVTRAGAGRRGDPYRYSASCFLVPTYRREQENEKRKSRVTGDELSEDSRSRENAVSVSCSRDSEPSREGADFWKEEVSL